MTEYDLHLQVAEYLRRQYPDAIFRTDLGGIKLSIGQAVKVKKLQAGRSFPDIILLEPRRGYHGMALELKRDAGEIYTKAGSVRQDQHVEEQRQMLYALEERGYFAVFGCGFDEARRLVDWYLGEGHQAR